MMKELYKCHLFVYFVFKILVQSRITILLWRSKELKWLKAPTNSESFILYYCMPCETRQGATATVGTMQRLVSKPLPL